jgi:hypothetical protein
MKYRISESWKRPGRLQIYVSHRHGDGYASIEIQPYPEEVERKNAAGRSQIAREIWKARPELRGIAARAHAASSMPTNFIP